VIYIDTGAFLARHIRRDQYHRRARAAWRTLSRLPWRCYTSNFVLDETFTLLARRASYPFAAQRARSIMASTTLEILRPSREDEMDALDLFEKFADQEVSFTDCISFVLMRKYQIKRVFSFDRHFRHAGFTLWPDEQ
jgi:predicted nucleic acid-binding protein